MGTADLTGRGYWESAEIDLRLNPRRKLVASGVPEFLQNELGLESAVVMATSGSSGVLKLVILSKAALLASADAVVAAAGIDKTDVLLAGLANFHVGGLGIYARAYRSGARVVAADWESWDREGSAVCDAITNGKVTITSLTPTHLHDLVEHRVVAPSCLRGVFLGGGSIQPELVAKASELGWPLWPSYGMTEASSQIATSFDGAVDWLPRLDHWDLRTNDEGVLQIKGPALFSGYLVRENDAWQFDPATDSDGWFTTGDRCELRDNALRFLGRCDHLVKVLGELVSLTEWQGRIKAQRFEGVVVALPDDRRENELVYAYPGPLEAAETQLRKLNEEVTSLMRLQRAVSVAKLPRTSLGKLDRVELVRQLRNPG